MSLPRFLWFITWSRSGTGGNNTKYDLALQCGVGWGGAYKGQENIVSS